MTGRYKTHKMTAEVLLNRQSFPLVIFKPIVVIFGIFSWLLCRANFNFRRYLVQKNWNFNLRINAIVRDKVQWVENGWEWCWRHLAYVTQLSEWVRARLSSAFAIFWSVASKPEREREGGCHCHRARPPSLYLPPPSDARLPPSSVVKQVVMFTISGGGQP